MGFLFSGTHCTVQVTDGSGWLPPYTLKIDLHVIQPLPAFGK